MMNIHFRLRIGPDLILNGVMDFADTLPDGCPPSNARELASALPLFRIVSSNPPTEKDFISYWHAQPGKREQWKDAECKARAISVYDSQKFCEDKLKLPTFKGKMVCRVTLPSGSGMVCAGGSSGHISWWVAKHCNPLECCEIVNAK